MSDKMTPIPFLRLLDWIFSEYETQHSIFGIHKSLYFKKAHSKVTKIFDSKIETLLGPAAGPHTQLAQNIITAYLLGARFFELKTVQKLDQLQINKPCIDARDECYNIEWSQELSLQRSYDEYLKAWILIHVLKDTLGLSQSVGSSFVFNMSVGYDLEGIKSKAMDDFINQLKNAEQAAYFLKYKKEAIEFLKKRNWGFAEKYIKPNINFAIQNLKNLSANISDSVTLSTMHGCPPQEIEAIATYLIEEKKLHTYVKLNPTLLGYQAVKDMLLKLGYDYIGLDANSFKNDLQYTDACAMLKRLLKIASTSQRGFGVKLSNTLGVRNNAQKLCDDSMYMSGRSLFPLTINLAVKLAKDFNGKLNISYSGGANQNNILDILQCGIYPVTMVTDLLKPGGYQRLAAMALEVEKETIPLNGKIDIGKLDQLALKAIQDPAYKKETRKIESIKTEKTLQKFDCYMAPCQQACPIHQDVAEYIRLIEEKRYSEAIETIYLQNPLPHITGYICDHQCMNHCTRWDYDSPVSIRDLKLHVAINGFDTYYKSFRKQKKKHSTGVKAAIIGAGPSGIAAAFFLARSGFDVTVYEKRKRAGGIVQNALPQFRLPQEAINKDIDFIKEHRVNFIFEFNENFSIENLKKQGFKYIYLAIGAGKSNVLKIPGTDYNLLEAIAFLENCNGGKKQYLGKTVTVVGGGNSAMDAARAATRVTGVEQVYIIYRRTKKQMPADLEEFDGAIADGVIFRELLQPVAYEKGRLKCQKMSLSKTGKDGRRSVEPIKDLYESIQVDTIISAIGEHVDYDLLRKESLLNEKNELLTKTNNESAQVENVFIGGDALSGPATVVEAIADARKAADAIITKEQVKPAIPGITDFQINSQKRTTDLIQKKGTLFPVIENNLHHEASRCLGCSFSCDKCVDVCPNRANITIAVKHNGNSFKDSHQILHLDGLCNECGNCETFCPYQGAPYKDKPTLFWSEEDFDNSSNDGFYFLKKQSDNRSIQIKIRENNNVQKRALNLISGRMGLLIKNLVKNYSYLLEKI